MKREEREKEKTKLLLDDWEGETHSPNKENVFVYFELGALKM